MSGKNYYDILELKKDATTEEIKSAYRRLARQHHPDKNRGVAYSDQKFKEISEAYQVLSDESSRRQYDAGGISGLGMRGGGFSFRFKTADELFAEMFPEEVTYLNLFKGDLFRSFFSFPDFRNKSDNPYRGNYAPW